MMMAQFHSSLRLMLNLFLFYALCVVFTCCTSGFLEDVKQCRVALYLASVIAEFSSEDILEEIEQGTERFQYVRRLFRDMYDIDESANCIAMHGNLVEALSTGRLTVSLPKSNSLNPMDLSFSLAPILNNLAAGRGGALTVFAINEGEEEEKRKMTTLAHGLCASRENCVIVQTLLSPILSFSILCATDVLIMTGESEMEIYAAALCSPLLIVSPPWLTRMHVFPTNIFLTMSSSSSSSITSTTATASSSFQYADTTGGIIFGQVLDTISDLFKWEHIDSSKTPRIWHLPTCREHQVLEPNAAQLSDGAVPCQYRLMDIQNISSDFDALRLAIEICENEFQNENVYNRRLLNSYTTAEGCVTSVAQKLIRHYLSDLLTFDEKKTSLYPSVDLYTDPESSLCRPNWMWELSKDEGSKHSQGGQDMVLQKILSIIGTSNKFFVELGFNADEFSHGSNTYLLHEQGWVGVLFDSSHENMAINLHKVVLTHYNIVETLRKHHVPSEVDYISIDIDSQDLWLLQSIIDENSGYRPRVISIEFNSHFPLAATVSLPPSMHGEVGLGWDGFDQLYGASAGAIHYLANTYGYELVHIVGIFDVFLVRRDLLNGACPPPLASFARKGGSIHYCVVTSSRRNQWVDVKTYLETGDIGKSRRMAREQMLLLYNPTGGFLASPDCLGLDGIVNPTDSLD